MNHWDLITERSYRIAQKTIDILDEHAVDHLLGGGWAVFAHVPSVPSIDTDVFVSEPLPASALDRFLAEGIAVGPQREVEPLDLHERVGFWAFGDDDLGVPTPGFVFADVLRPTVGELRLGGRIIPVRVPSPGSMALVKLCALHNRDLALRSFRSGEAGMHIGPQRMPLIRAESETYYLRKAGKDLFDVAALLTLDGAARELQDIAEPLGLMDVLFDIEGNLAAATRRYARDLAASVDAEAPHVVLQQVVGGTADE